jgi:hypothetical protein
MGQWALLHDAHFCLHLVFGSVAGHGDIPAGRKFAMAIFKNIASLPFLCIQSQDDMIK